MPTLLKRFETLLVAALLLEIALFSCTATHFASLANAFEILRLNADVALLALAMTPVILTGGIDLSVGSLLGLCAVLFGKMWRDGGLSPGVAAVGALLAGALGGGVNAFFIARLRLPPLIVTLGTFSLYRGLAEAMTRGVDNFTGFPPGFLFLGQGYLGGLVPAQAPLLVLMASAIWLLVHRTTFGRSFRALGFSPEGTRYAGLPAARRLALAYVLAGTLSAVAALLYVAYLGQAKADAGTGYELFAITAVVLGGCSIFGGTGTIHGTLLGLAVLAVLRNGLTLSDLPAELAGILTGALLLTVLAAEVLAKRLSRHHASSLKTVINPLPSLE